MVLLLSRLDVRSQNDTEKIRVRILTLLVRFGGRGGDVRSESHSSKWSVHVFLDLLDGSVLPYIKEELCRKSPSEI